MIGIISGIRNENRNKVSFIVSLEDADGGLIVLSRQKLEEMAQRSKIIFNRLSDLNGRKCYAKLLSDNRIIHITGIQ